MKTLLNFTPRLVMSVMFITLLCPSLFANGNATSANVTAQSASQIITSFIVLLLVIVLPLMKKRKVTATK